MQAREIILIIAAVAAVALVVYGVWMKIKVFILEERERDLFKEASKPRNSNERTVILLKACNCRRRIEELKRRGWFIVGALCVLLIIVLILIRC